MKFYITAISIFVLAVFYMPLVIWILKRIWRNPRWRGMQKAGVLTLAVLLAYAIPLGDVTVNSLAMAKVCPTAGLHIYKTVEVEGLVGHYDVRDRPYRFIEFPTMRANGTHYWIRSEKQPDGSVTTTELERPTAEYEIVYVQWHKDITRGVESSAYIVRNINSGEILAERNLFNPLSGWVDRALVYRWFGYGGREGCHGAPSAGIDETRILIPKKVNH